MGFLGGDITVKNQTPYEWTICLEVQVWPFPNKYAKRHLEAFQTRSIGCIVPVTWGKTFYIKVKYGSCSETQCYKQPDLWYELNPKDDPLITIQERGDEVHLDCNINYEKKKSTCPNYGKLEDDAQQREVERRQEKANEEQRWRAQRELERRIEEQIKRESEISAKRLSQANEKLKQKEILRGQEFHQQAHIIHQPLEVYTVDRDEVAETENNFLELLLRYEITEIKDTQDSLPDRMKRLQNEIMVDYCKKHNLSSSCMFSFDAAVDYDTLPLSDRLSVLEAVLQVVFEETEDGHEPQYDRDVLLSMLEQLIDTHQTLAGKLLQNVLYTDVQLSMQSKEILCQILFNNMWTPGEITDFMRNITGKATEQVSSVLHTAQTYKLEYGTVFNALGTSNPLNMLQNHVDNERHKDAKTILSEMHDENVPENVLTILEDVLLYLEKELPKTAAADLSESEVEDLKKMVKSLDFNDPDRDVLKQVLVKMSVAVKMCSTIIIQKDEKNTVIEGYLPRLTQLATLVIFLLSKSETNTGCLLEIGTGEGKSCILAMLAAIHAIRGVNVDLVTSSPVLSCRDLEEWKGLYNMFGITSSVVPPPFNDSPPEKQNELVQDAYSKQVVYSTVGTFAADTLRQEFEKKTTRGERSFEMVLVDEVDYMTLDNGVQITFLSHESRGLQHLEQVLASIWAVTSACRPIQMEETGEIMWATRVQNFHTAALLAMIGSDTSDTFSPLDILLPGIELGFYSEDDFEMLKASVSAGERKEENATLYEDTWKSIMAKTGVEQQYALLSILEMGMENKVAFNCYVYQSETRKAAHFGEQKTETDQNVNMLLLENGKACEIMSEKVLVEATVKELTSKIKYSKQCRSNADTEENTLVIPPFMEEYLQKQLPVFVENALKAIQMTKGREYLIEKSLRAQGVDISEEDQHMYHTVIPVDFQASGMLEKRKRWGDGLQQFLEMKHQLALSPLSNVTNYMSNRSFFKRYLSGKGIFGVSGTLGGDADKSFLTRHYKTDCYVIPAHQRKKVTELPAVQVKGRTDEWIQMLCDTVSKVSDRGQVVLVVCEDVNTANALNEKITAGTRHPVTMYTNSESHSIENQEFTEGQIIISTNLGGRGTDIKVTKKVSQRGGLFVILTYFPNNRRVEQQVFGRTGRKGTPGMVQLILNHEHLAQAYQGHSIEIMRELREEYESERIKHMEKEKLVEIEMKEELFSTFCHFLSDFDQHYSTEEKTDLFEVRVKDVPRYFESHCTKMDYNPALNALKESWGLWLILHTDQINTENDIKKLKEDLIQHLQNTSDKLLQGNSENFYDHIQQALGRTALHFQNKTKRDYGAKFYWEKASESDNCYRAVALYNQAYVTINMAEKNYKNEARALLEEAEKAIDVYVSETANTLSLVSMSVTGDFEPHHSGTCNFQTQMQARMNIFQSWKRNITGILKVLAADEGDVTTGDSALYSLSSCEDFVSSNEFSLFHNYGLAVVFEVKQKPRFSFDALICCFIGVAQVVAGVLICALSAGSLSSFGLGLISEGVSDIISGVMGMINGTFDWASWALSKAISIGISLACGGFRAIKRSVTSVREAASGILKGTKSLRSVASSAVKSGKQLFVSASTSVKSAVSSVCTQSFTSMCTSNVFKSTVKNAGMYAVQEIAIQGTNAILNKCIDVTVQKGFKLAFQQYFKDSVYSALKENKEFDKAITVFIGSVIPKTALECDDYKIDKNLEKKITDNVNLHMNFTISNLMAHCNQVHRLISTCSQLWDQAAAEFQEHISNKTNTCIKTLLKTANTSTYLYKMYSSLPTKNTINSKFVPAFLECMTEDASFETYDEDGRDNLEDVKRLADELTDLISEGLSKALVDRFSDSASSICAAKITQRLNSTAREVVGNLFGRHETQSFFDNQQHHYDLKSAKEHKDESLSEGEKNEIESYASKITDEQHPATALELHVLTKSDLLEGKGICVTVVDAQGKLLSEETYPGTDPASGNIRVLLTKTPENSSKKEGMLSRFKSRIMGQTTPHSGHFDTVRSDGSTQAVNSENQNCLFHAVIQATTNAPDDVVQEKAKELRIRVSKEIQSKPGKYVNALKVQNMFNQRNSCNKFKIVGGVRKGDEKKYKEYIKNKEPQQIIHELYLGDVGEYEQLRQKNMNAPVSGIVEADHVPPKSVLEKIRNKSMVKDNNVNLEFSMNTLYHYHRHVLTSGSSKESKACRDLLVKTFNQGDTVEGLKLSLMMAHPEFSDNLRNKLHIQRNFKTFDSGLPQNKRNKYYKDGYVRLVEAYSSKSIIDQNQKTELMRWIDQDQFLKDKPLTDKMIAVIPRNKK
ncbi:hypothetical protein SRHO_G00031270 [Serrasalmus rhombeus]